MFKFLFLFLFFYSFSNATSFYDGKCVSSFNVSNGLLISKINVYYSNGQSESFTYADSKYQVLVDNNNLYKYDSITNTCSFNDFQTYNNDLGISDFSFNLLSGLTGLFSSLLIVSSIMKRV